MSYRIFLESGILEQYVLGITSPKESKEVLKYANQKPQIRKEIQAIEEALLRYAMLFSAKPPHKVKDEIIQKIESEGINNVQIKRATDYEKYISWRAIALLTILLILIANASYQNRRQSILNLEKERLNKKIDSQKERLQSDFQNTQLDDKLTFLRHRSTLQTILNGTPLAENAKAVLYSNSELRVAYLAISKLPRTGADMQYQLWAHVNDEAIEMESIDIPSATLIPVRFIENAEAISISLGQSSGVKTPTAERIYLYGEL